MDDGDRKVAVRGTCRCARKEGHPNPAASGPIHGLSPPPSAFRRSQHWKKLGTRPDLHPGSMGSFPFSDAFMPTHQWPNQAFQRMVLSPRARPAAFHPHADVAEPGSYRPVGFADPVNTFHDKAVLCRAAENTCCFASVNCASEGSGTSSAVARSDGTLHCFQPYGQAGLLVADLDLRIATGLLASRRRTSPM
jgi:hypothetical protein